MNDIIKKIEDAQLKAEAPEFRVGDTVKVYGKIKEGVETVEQLMFLCNLDCDDIQGYYFSRPLPVKEYEECLKEACM